jgi:hypothetical protein
MSLIKNWALKLRGGTEVFEEEIEVVLILPLQAWP